MRFEVETNIYNPSALSRKFSSIQTQFDVTLGKISAIISDSDIEQYTDGHTTMNTRLSATIQDLEGFHQTVSQMQTTYNGNFTSINSQLSTLEQTISGISASVSSVSQNAIKSDTIHYLATSFSSGVTRNTAGWTDTPQSITATNRYLWIYHTYTRGDNSTVNTDPVIAGVWGNTGNIGNTGVSVSSIVNYYLASASSSGITRETSGWTATIQNISQNYPYLWNYEIVYGDDNSVLNITDPVIIGRYGSNGANGRGISSVTEYYQKSSSNTTAPTTWSTSLVNTTTTDKYLWNYERITYTDGTTEDSTKRIIGVYGDTGARGSDGVSITNVTTLRYASSSSTAPNAPQSKVTSQSINAGNWTTAVPALSTTYPYMYTCDQIEWDDNTVTWTSVVRDNALTDLVSRVSAAELKITDSAIVSTVRSSTAYQNDLSSKNASYTGDYKPTASNDPASSWTTTALKESHINDTFLTSAGELYQYIYGCYGLMITFDDLSETETPSFDYVEIYYQIDGTTYVLPHLGGTAISGKNIFVPAPVFWLYWKSDSSVTKYGFKIKSIERGFNARPELVEGTLPSLTPTELSGTDYPETTHPYTNDEEKFWKYSTSNTGAGTLSYGWSLRSDPNKTSAFEVNSIIEQKADSIRLKADKISWQSTYSSMTENGVLTCTGANINGIITALGDETLLTIGDASVPNINPRSSYYSVVDSEGMIFKRFVNNNLRGIRYIGSPSSFMQDVTCASSSFAIRTVTLVDETNLPSNYDYSGNTTGHLKEEFSNSGTNNPTYRLTLSKNKIYDGEVAGFTLGRNNIYLYCGNIHMDLDTSIPGIDIVSSKGVVKAYRYGVTLMATSGIASGTSNYVGGFSYGSSLEAFTIGNYSDTSKNLRGLGSNVALYYCNRSVQLSGGSSRRFKHDISNLNNDELDPHRLLMLKPKQFIYNDEYPVEYMDMKNKLIPGFIAEEVAEIYPSALIHDELDGTIKNWDVRRIVPGMLSLIQELFTRVQDLERRL